MDDATATNPVSDLVQQVTRMLAGPFEQMSWAEDEIHEAARRHPGDHDLLFHAFSLLVPTHPLMTTEMVYRAHCRELLERVISGADTRPGTAAEVCCACCKASLAGPLNTSAAGLYARMWAAAFPDQPMPGDLLRHYEALGGSAIDDLEAMTRRKLAVSDRKPGDITCAGRHHGEDVTCRFDTR